MGRKIGLLVLGAFLVFFVVNSPTDAADIVKNCQHIVAHGFRSMTQFVDSFRN